MPSGYTFVIADDHPLFRGALKEALAGVGDVAAIHEAGDFESAKALVVANEDVALVLLDLSMPGASGLDLLRSHGVGELVLAGGVRRPSLSSLRPDWRVEGMRPRRARSAIRPQR